MTASPSQVRCGSERRIGTFSADREGATDHSLERIGRFLAVRSFSRPCFMSSMMVPKGQRRVIARPTVRTYHGSILRANVGTFSGCSSTYR